MCNKRNVFASENSALALCHLSFTSYLLNINDHHSVPKDFSGSFFPLLCSEWVGWKKPTNLKTEETREETTRLGFLTFFSQIEIKN